MSDGKIVYKVDYDTKDGVKNIGNLESKIKNIGEKSSELGSTLTKGVTMPILAGAAAVTAGLIAMGSELDNTKKTAIGLNADVEALQALRFAAGKAGIESDKMDDALKKINESVVSNVDVFDKYNIQIKDANKNMLSSDEIFHNILTALNNVDDATRGAMMSQLGFTEEVVTFNKALYNSEGFLADYNKGLETAVSSETISKFEEFNDTVSDIKERFKEAGAQIGTEYIDDLNKVADWFSTDGVDAITDFIDKVLELGEDYGDVMLVIAGSAAAAGPIMKAVGAMASLGVAGTGVGFALGLTLIPFLAHLDEGIELTGKLFGALMAFLSFDNSKFRSIIDGIIGDIKDAQSYVSGATIITDPAVKSSLTASHQQNAEARIGTVNIDVKSTIDGNNSARVANEIAQRITDDLAVRGVMIK